MVPTMFTSSNALVCSPCVKASKMLSANLPMYSSLFDKNSDKLPIKRKKKKSNSKGKKNPHIFTETILIRVVKMEGFVLQSSFHSIWERILSISWKTNLVFSYPFKTEFIATASIINLTLRSKQSHYWLEGTSHLRNFTRWTTCKVCLSRKA